MLVQKILFNYRDNKKKRIQLIKTKFFSNLLNIFKPDQIRAVENGMECQKTVVPLFLFVLSSLKQSKQDPNPKQFISPSLIH